MGCLCSAPKDQEDIDREVLGDFLQKKENLKTIWNQFNKNEDDVLDRAEFDRLLFTALQIFCKERDPEYVICVHIHRKCIIIYYNI